MDYKKCVDRPVGESYRKAMKNLIFTSLIFVCSVCLADTLKPAEFSNQFGEKASVDESTKWLIFSNDKNLSDVVKKTLDDLKITDLSKSGGQYVADISKMPGLISQMFAIPKMKEYEFKLALDQEGEATKPWPKKEGHVTMMKLNKLEILETNFALNQEELTKFIKAQVSP